MSAVGAVLTTEIPVASPQERHYALSMCGRYTLTGTIERLLLHYGLGEMGEELPADYLPRYNIAPTQLIPAILRTGEGLPSLQLLRWGLVPAWADDPAIGNRMINARGETVASRPSFRSAFARRRCLLPADGWYEWRKPAVGRNKQPYHIALVSGEPFAFAGLWEEWTPRGGGEALRTCTIITTEAAPAIRPIHDRMPALLNEAGRDAWLDPQTPRNALQDLLRPYPGEDLRAHPVSRLVNTPANDRPECVEPVPEPSED
jgi:putative SOS response-associated peptidase YedK